MKDIYDFMKSFDLHTIIVVGIAFWWLNGSMNEKFNQLQKDMTEVKSDITEVKSDIKVMKAVMYLHGMMPKDIAWQNAELQK